MIALGEKEDPKQNAGLGELRARTSVQQRTGAEPVPAGEHEH
nr:MAG TPA: hypothetical protein [Caudoviricetes sp.]